MNRIILSFCIILLLSFLTLAATAETLALENAYLKLEFDAASGALVSMVNKKSGSEYIGKASEYPPFILDVTPANQSYYIRDYSLREFGGFSLADPDSISLVPGDIKRVRGGSPIAGRLLRAIPVKRLPAPTPYPLPSV